MSDDLEHARWLADKIGALGDYAKEAADVLRRQADELTRLRSENEALTEKAAALSEDCANWQRRHAELEAKLAEAGRDAERYREARRDPRGFVHLLKLMLKDKADGRALDEMMDRIMESRRLAAERKESGNG